eukprot:TRINITY_DN1250_c0_g1_i3.p1 TRINITY_DN1250_c0_g1~~TRINITY_DN1250_c0_g1_i3.p1  ORF type:complete len:433 (-),score=60.88 TRINITY_DN1250_c0_g1_i3:24-1322(-)
MHQDQSKTKRKRKKTENGKRKTENRKQNKAVLFIFLCCWRFSYLLKFNFVFYLSRRRGHDMQKKKIQRVLSADFSGKKYNYFPFEELEEKAVGAHSVNLNKNDITTIPADPMLQIAHSSWRYSLDKFSICRNLLRELPREIGLLVNLRVLRLDDNALTFLPNEITQLSNLQILTVRGNRLTRLPEDLRGLDALEELDISKNKITRLPRSIAFLDNLGSVQIKHNPIVYPPAKVFDKDRLSNDLWPQIRFYLRDPMSFVKQRFSSHVKFRIEVPAGGDLSAGLTEFSKRVRVLLANKQGRACFAKFLERECSLENLLFWEEVEQLKLHGSFMAEEDYKNQSLLIFFKYIKVEVPEACSITNLPIEINLPCEIKQECCAFFEAPNVHLRSIADYDDILSKAQSNIFQLLAFDSYNRFLSSTEALEVKQLLPELV